MKELVPNALKGASIGLILGCLDFYLGFFLVEMSMIPILLFLSLYVSVGIVLSIFLTIVSQYMGKLKKQPGFYNLSLIILFTYCINLGFINLSLFRMYNFDNLNATNLISNLLLFGLAIFSLIFMLRSGKIGKFFASNLNFYFASLLILGFLNYNQYFFLGSVFPKDGFLRIIFWLSVMGLFPVFSLFVISLIKEQKRFVIAAIVLLVLTVPHIIGQPILSNYAVKNEKSNQQTNNIQKNSKHNIIWIVMDTVLRDRTSLYGYHRNTTPNLVKFSKDGVIFSNPVSTAPWTMPSHSSMFTGMYPSKHGTHHSTEKFFTSGLADENITIAEVLRGVGYKTGAIVANDAIGRNKGYEQGFDVYFDGVSAFKRFLGGHLLNRMFPKISFIRYLKMNRYLLSPQISETALQWVNNNKDNRFFLFINYMDVHAGYSYLPDGYEGKYGFNWDDMEIGDKVDWKSIVNHQKNISEKEHQIFIDLTDCKLTYLDNSIGKLFEDLKKMKLYDDSFIIVTSDHGTLWGEHNSFGHLADLYNELLYVPLVIKYPKTFGKTGVNNTWVQTLDIMPEILYSLGIPIPEEVQGQPIDLLDHEIAAEVFKNEKALSTKLNPEKFFRDLKAIYSTDNNFKFIQSTDGKSELYNLRDDPYELNNLYKELPKIADNLNQTVTDWHNSFEPIKIRTTKTDIDTALIKRQLKSLGYIK